MTPHKVQRTPKSSRSRRAIRKKRSQPLLFNGLGSILAGAALWIVSLVMRAEDSTAYAAKALLAPAWMGLILGVGLIITHVVGKHRAKLEAEDLLRQHSTFLEPMPRLSAKRPPSDKATFRSRPRSSSTAP
ncbi:hypothetical protein [Hydrogenophaga sp.]|uniref:hypothetical protein n=1 Tax=Hydrogenophaga sp. TaxID=1904254 RepID=UPI002719646A|nr:hypothetical protein [Hydrogenophaga sp.]MDO9437565.1 hypothetical protein [Hydrogenophaga sp.]